MKLGGLSDDSIKENKQENLLKYLLESGQNENVLLAFQILSNQELLSHTFATHFLLLSVFSSSDIQKKADFFVKQNIPKQIVAAFYATNPEKIINNSLEKATRNTLEAIAQISGIDRDVLGNLTFRLTNKGASFCLKYRTNNPETILRQFLMDNVLDLSDLDLDKLPSEIGLFSKIKTLDLSGNSFSQVPPEVQNLHNLQNFFYIGTPLNKETINFLTEKFPRVFANKHYRRASQLYNREQYKVALKEINNALKLYPNDHHFWNAKGIIMKRLGRFEQASYSFKKALLKGKAEKKRDFSQEGKSVVKKAWAKPVEIKKEERSENTLGIENYWQQGLLLQKANAFLKLQKYQDALNIYQKIIPHFYQDANFWYQLSTTLFHLKREKAFVLAIKQAIILDENLLKKAKEDFAIHQHLEFNTLFVSQIEDKA